MAKKKVKKVSRKSMERRGRPPKVSEFAMAAKRFDDPTEKRISIERRDDGAA